MDALLARIPSRLLTEWMAYAKIEPFGEEQENLRAAFTITVLANANRDPNKKREPYTVQEILRWLRPDDDEPARPAGGAQGWEQQKAMMQQLTAKMKANQ